MTIRIYNTLTRKKEALQTLEPGHVKLYVCGITSYDYCHIGHARSVLVFDMVVRYLRYRGWKVTFVRNFTDIDDKIIRRAEEQNIDAQELAERFIHEFFLDMEALDITAPDLEPRATEHIAEMIELIDELVEQGLAYASDGDVYFRVNRFPEYGRLSGRSLEDMQAGARIQVNHKKEHPMDFTLWKAAKPGEPKWSSPWGEGRPGWHIECSAMSRRYLGTTFDIHGGGKDLIFPHHENEIAQSCGVSGAAFARYWMHHGFVTIADEKMSKSLGNFRTIREVLAAHEPEVLRLFIFSTQYRNPLDFTPAALQDALTGLVRMYECLAAVQQLQPAGDDQPVFRISVKDRTALEAVRDRFEQAMNNDFNTAQAIGHLFNALKVMNKQLQALNGQAVEEDLQLLRKTAVLFVELGAVLGILQQDPEQVITARREAMLAEAGIDEGEILALIDERAAARARKDWAASDAVRDRLLAMNIVLKDGPGGTTWEVAR
ncbi:MAG: cysteine--tRNA ligase [Desulfobulbus propionicus]|nr:MAG: cysteine--tRNA ligase [Desulfobulbus propionicus]